ncbi:MAG: hypothetical protein GY952_11670 [Rhodobacteraceae bacterium]|nr:hypothetical protein [Paracoccaceae bacterium]
MRTRPSAITRRTATPQPARNKTKPKTFPPPVRGWIRNENLAASGPGGAYVLDNWFPTSKDIRVRGGSNKYATIGSSEVDSLFTYRTGLVEKFFAADATKVFDISTVADPDVAPSAAVTGQTSGEYGVAQMGTVGGDYLICCNGDDTPLLYDGSSWSTTSITGVTQADLEAPWVFGSRMFFVEKDTMSTWYLAIDAISGAASEFSLDGIFQKGGELMFGDTWSLDSGSGLDDKCVFVSTTGEVAIYEGTDPSSASTWSKVGVYQITTPLGIHAKMRAGGDLIIATEDGMVPLSEAITKDSAALSLSAVTRQIEPEWKLEYADRASKSWHVLKWASNNMCVVSLPVIDDTTPARCFVVNLETGAWCRYTGWETQCLGLFNEIGHFGTSDGKVYQMEVTGSDDGTLYTGTYVGLFDHLESPGQEKIVHSARGVFTVASEIDPKFSISSNYAVSLPTAPNSILDYAAAVWDSAEWDTDVWDYSADLETRTKWVSIGRAGFSIAPQLQVTMNVTPKPNVELVAIDLMYEDGGVMV